MEPGYDVLDADDGEAIEVICRGSTVTVHGPTFALAKGAST